MTAQPEGTLHPKSEFASSKSPSTLLLSQARSEGTAALLLSSTAADSISPRCRLQAAASCPPCLTLICAAPGSSASPRQAGEGDVLKWLFPVDCLVPMQSSGRSRLTCLLIFKRRGWKGRKEEEMGQEAHFFLLFSGRARAPSTAYWSEHRLGKGRWIASNPVHLREKKGWKEAKHQQPLRSQVFPGSS